MEETFNILFTADVHGNIKQYKKIFEEAKNSTDALILGGDITPKDKERRTPQDQKEFLENELFPLIKKFKEENDKCRVLIILGNDDFRPNFEIMKNSQKEIGFEFIQGECVDLIKNIKICGYTYVPITPFKFKDWEKIDTKEPTKEEQERVLRLEGKIANETKKEFNLNDRQDTLEKDLEELTQGIKDFVLVTHSPPFNSNLDMIKENTHVGSLAVKKIIQERKPLVSLHGHIHETFDISGEFKEQISDTLSLTASNDHIGENPYVIKFNLFDTKDVKRFIL